MGKSKRNNYFFSKALIVFFSLMAGLNGLGLIVAGIRVKKKSWTIVGVGYIVLETVLVSIGSYSIPCLLYLASIIHTALICSEYGRLLGDKNANVYGKVTDGGYDAEDVSKKSTNVDEISDKTKSICFDNIYLPIGLADVDGKSRNDVKISIRGSNGSIYEFNTKGNLIESVSCNGKNYNYGG